MLESFEACDKINTAKQIKYDVSAERFDKAENDLKTVLGYFCTG